MSQETLHVFKRNILVKEIGGRKNPCGMRCSIRRKAGAFASAFEHFVDVVSGHSVLGKSV